MRVLIFGDIYGRLGRKAFLKEFRKLSQKYSPDFSVVNIENITSWRGPVTEHADLIESQWVDVMTSGDHIFDNAPNIHAALTSDTSILIRPANFYEPVGNSLPGKGYVIVKKWEKRLLVIQLLGEVFMSHKVHNPFLKVQEILDQIPPESYDAVVLDFHRETTAELYGMAHFLDGKVSLVYGTHTHIQTNDAHILPHGTWILADVGMNGPFNSVIGAEYQSVEKRFLSGIQRWKIEQQLKGPYIINALVADIDEKTKQCISIENISYTWNL